MFLTPGCATLQHPAPEQPAAPIVSEPALQSGKPPAPLPPLSPPQPTTVQPQPMPSVPPLEAPPPAEGTLVAADWRALPGWTDDDLSEAWPALIASCMALKTRPGWQAPCWAAVEITQHDPATLRKYFEEQFRPYRVLGADGSDSGLVTGYYEPLLRGSRTPNGVYKHPLYGVPDDLLVVELGDQIPELKGLRVRGRLEGRRVVPYYSRGDIDTGAARLTGRELLWVDDPVELFFLHVQGSGRVRLDSGETVRVGYADHNGHPYRSIGRALIERGELTPDKASMQGIKNWGKEHPDKLAQLLAENPAYVFFREMPANGTGPLGSLNVPLTPRRSIAIDPRNVPLGAPVYLATTWPNSTAPKNRLTVAQDTGAAIKGMVRADLFWGFGDEASQFAGRMRQPGRMWVLLPKDAVPAP
ncbi:MAG: murein transglycosylase A, partial [Burkholderiales bacterium]